MIPDGVHAFSTALPIDNKPTLCGVKPSTSFVGNILDVVSNSSS